MKKFLIALFTTFTLMFSGSASADYPSGPVQFLVPWPPGDFEDILTRMIAEEWKVETGMPASVVNRPGGGDGPFPGALEVLEAPADGSMIGSFVIGVPIIGPRIGIGIEQDSFEPIGIFVTYPFVLAASGDAPYSNLKELAAHAKNNDVILGHFGEGLIPTKATLAAAKKLGFEFGEESPNPYDAWLGGATPAEYSGRGDLDEVIKKEGDNYVVKSEDGKTLGTHSSRKKAQAQLYAIHKSQEEGD